MPTDPEAHEAPTETGGPCLNTDRELFREDTGDSEGES